VRPRALLRRRRILLELALRQPQGQGDRDESLLRTIVEVALQLPARIVAGRNDCAGVTLPALAAAAFDSVISRTIIRNSSSPLAAKRPS